MLAFVLSNIFFQPGEKIGSGRKKVCESEIIQVLNQKILFHAQIAAGGSMILWRGDGSV